MLDVLPILHKKAFFRTDRNGGAEKQLDAAIAYIRETPEIRDCLISGGDGLLINDQILEYILKNLRDIPILKLSGSERERPSYFRSG